MYLSEVVEEDKGDIYIRNLESSCRGMYSLSKYGNSTWEPIKNVSAIAQPTRDKRNYFVFDRCPLP